MSAPTNATGPYRDVPSTEGFACSGCGYSLTGLDADGVCPECGFSVARSLEGAFLANSSPEYVRSLRVGLTIIIFGALAQVLFSILSAVGSVGFAIATQNAQILQVIQIVMSVGGLAIGLAILYGWWRFSAPDPGYTGRDDGSNARRWIRVAVLAVAAAQAGSLGMQVAMWSGAIPIAILVLAGLIGFVGFVAGGVQFFASVLYVRWLAPRIPNRALDQKAKRNLWLLPLLYVLIITAIVSWILYLLMLNTLRRDLGRIIDEQRPLDAA